MKSTAKLWAGAMADVTYLVTIDDGTHTHCDEFDTLEEAREDYEHTIKYYSQRDAPNLECVVLETAEDYEVIEEHHFEYET